MLANYQKRANDFQQTAQQLQQRYERLGIVRIASFLLLAALIIVAWRETPWWSAFLLTIGGIFAFAQLVRWHGRIQAASRHQQRLSDVNTHELQASQNDHSAFATGERFIDPLHPYSYDMDIFGEHSIFQMVNRAQTSIGQNKLASWFDRPSDTKDILARQAAAQELAQMLEWQHQLRAYGAAINEQEGQIKRLFDWLKLPAIVMGNSVRTATLFIAPVLFMAAMYLWATTWPWFLAFSLLIPAVWVLKQALEEINELHKQTGKAADSLQAYAQLIAHIEGVSFKSPLLQQLQAPFLAEDKTASAAIKKLAYRLSQLDVRYNAFSILLQISFVWDLHQAHLLDKWKANYGQHLHTWFESLATIEALVSLGNLSTNQPDWVFPQINEQKELKASALGHPLLSKDACVTNDMSMPTHGHMHLITGSNMAGKSTWLRTLGINMVLALSGSPVRAQQMQLPQMQVYTSMRTQDALHESTSSFYAELKRLKFIIEAVEDPSKTNGRPVFFLLDEILKGTNSRDRHTGSKALIRQLIASAGAGVIATHDLELGGLEAESNGQIENWTIEVDIKNNELYFDYKIKQGVCKSFNATLLMQKMGIKI